MWENKVRETGPQQVVARATPQILSNGIFGAQHHFSQAGLCPLGSNQLLLRTLWGSFLHEQNSNVWHISLCIFNDGKSTTFDGEQDINTNEELSIENQM